MGAWEVWSYGIIPSLHQRCKAEQIWEVIKWGGNLPCASPQCKYMIKRLLHVLMMNCKLLNSYRNNPFPKICIMCSYGVHMMSLVTNLIKATSSDNQSNPFLGLYKTRGPITQDTIQRVKASYNLLYLHSVWSQGLLYSQGKQRCALHVVCVHLSLSLSECVASISCCVVHVCMYSGTAVWRMLIVVALRPTPLELRKTT